MGNPRVANSNFPFWAKRIAVILLAHYSSGSPFLSITNLILSLYFLIKKFLRGFVRLCPGWDFLPINFLTEIFFRSALAALTSPTKVGELAQRSELQIPLASKAVCLLSQKIFTTLKFAGDEGIEPSISVLETEVIPLN